MERKFTTLDLYLAAYLEVQGLYPELHPTSGRVVFELPQTRELEDAISAFNTNRPVPVTDYVIALKTLRARMYNVRGR